MVRWQAKMTPRLLRDTTKLDARVAADLGPSSTLAALEGEALLQQKKETP